MRKSLSLILSAALTLSSVLPSFAAPLAKKDVAQQTGPAKAAQAVASTKKDAKGKLSLTSALRKSKVKGIKNAKSELKSNSLKALRSAQAASNRAVSPTVNLRGVLIYSAAEDAEVGLYTIPTTAGGSFEQIAPFELGYSYGAVDNGAGLFYGVSYESFMGLFEFITLDIYDTNTWELLSSQDADYNVMSTGAALDPTSGDIYGVFFVSDGASLDTYWAKADYENLTSQPIAAWIPEMLSVACDKDGQFYGMTAAGQLLKIDKTTGDYEVLYTVELPYNEYIVSGCYDDVDGKYLQHYNSDDASGIVEIDMATGELSLLVEYPNGDEITGLYIARPEADDKAPAAPALTVTCENGAMTVTATMTMPTTLFDGTPLAADATLSYTLTSNGETLKEGTAAAGETITETIEMAESGMAKFELTCSNDTGKSPRATASVYVGKGTPNAPKNVVLTVADGTATLTWAAVTEAADAGYFDAAAVTYTVYDIEGEKVAEGLTATTYTTAVDTPENGITLIGYSVVAVYDGKSSTATASNKVSLGNLAAPVTVDMTSADNFTMHSVLDVNNDGSTWMFNTSSNVTQYKYNGSNAGDDWLFTPGIKLEAGKVYPITVVAGNNSTSYVEKLAVNIGREATAEGMTDQLLAPTELTGNVKNTFELFYTPTEAGVYNIGFHALSEPDQFYLYLYSYSIGEGMNPTAPEAVTNATAKGAANGDLKAGISFKAPSTSINGAALSGNVTVKVLCGDRLVRELTGKPGMSYSIDDTVTEEGNYTYTFETYNAAGAQGKTVSVTTYIGPKAAANPTNLNAVAIDDNHVKLTWDPVTTDVDGNTVPASNITYAVWSVEDGYLGEIIADGLTTSEYIVTLPAIAVQDFVQWGVQAFNRGKESKVPGVGCIVGPAYELPVLYTGMSSVDLMLVYGGDGEPGFGSSELGIPAQDGDDSYYTIKSSYLDDTTYLSFGKTKFDAEKPVVIFYIYAIDGENPDVNLTTVSVEVDGEVIDLQTISNADLTAGEWNKVKVSLADVKGKTGCLRLTTVCKNYAYTLYDNILMTNDTDYDLAVSLAAPARVATGEEFTLTAAVTNEGAKDADAYTVNITRDGKVIFTEEVSEPLAADDKATFTFTDTLDRDADSAEYQAEVVFAQDKELDNNKSAVITVNREKSNLPTVQNLEGEHSDADNVLTWDAIATDSNVASPKTFDFEDCTSFAQEIDGWTFLDGDGSAVGGFQGKDLPGIEAGESTLSFFVFDSSDASFNQTFDAHSGNKYLAALFRYDDGTTDDWLISPELTGDAQTVSFFASSYSNSYPEKIEIYYTKGDAEDLDSYVQVKTLNPVPNGWTEVTFDIPAGATYFAIRSCATGSFMLMLDDFTFLQPESFDGELKGYNVYCDGEKLNDTPLTETTYTHVGAAAEDHTYHVTAVYDKGESEFSAPLVLADSAVELAKASKLSVKADNGAILISGAEGSKVAIASVDGKVIYTGSGDARVAVAPAIYMVTVNGKTVKLIVR